MSIRKATSADSRQIAKLFLLAMNTLVYRFIGEADDEKAIDFLVHFIQQKENQYSYQNCFVAIEDHQIEGVINSYDGALLQPLRQPILDFIHQHYNSEFILEDETQAGEIYIDVVSVSPSKQGKGIGSQLLRNVIEEFCIKDKKTIGLLVDKKNPNAKRLYLQLGFEKVGEKKLSGHEMEHLQLKI
jgi:ribosomal protein S18 acetylase RimI-like enzyme